MMIPEKTGGFCFLGGWGRNQKLDISFLVCYKENRKLKIKDG